MLFRSSQAFELFFPGSPSIINNILSVLYTGGVSSGVSQNPAITGIFGGLVGRPQPSLVGHQSVYFLLCLTLTFKELRKRIGGVL